MSGKDKWVRRFNVDETARHEKGFTIYKITSILFPLSSPEAVTVVSVWKRYSDAQTLHKCMKSLHSGLHLKGIFPDLAKYGYFKRFDEKVIQERARSIKALLEFVAEHNLLFTSVDFVNFLQTGYPEPQNLSSRGTIQEIRSSLHLPLEDAPVLDCRASDEENSSPSRAITQDQVDGTSSINELIPQIPIYEASDVEIRNSPKIERNSPMPQKISPTTQNSPLTQKKSGSLDSFNSLESIGSDLYDNISKISVDKPKILVKNKNNLPDLINFDEPSTSIVNQSDMGQKQSVNTDSETVSITSTDIDDSRRSISRLSIYRSLLELDNKSRTENSYVFEAGYLLNLAARSEDLGEYQKAFDFYKNGIEKMLIGVKTDPDPQRRALIKEKTNKYLSYAEDIYRNHLTDVDYAPPLKPPQAPQPPPPAAPGIEYLSEYRVLGLLADKLVLGLHQNTQTCRAIKVIQKIPKNLTEFDENFSQNFSDTRNPILPTNIPYMVPLHCYIETNNLIFLILSYAPGEKLFNYIKNYVNSTPNTPARQNLENVFNEPLRNETLDNENHSDNDKNHNDNDNLKTEDLEILQMVKNSQKLLRNVDEVLMNIRSEDKSDNDKDNKNDKVMEPTPRLKLKTKPYAMLPPSTIRLWAAQVLVALEGLHQAGVICRDLNPNNILLSDGGQIILTYFIGYPGLDMALKTITQAKPGNYDLYIAPELYYNTILDENGGWNDEVERCCDFWSFGAILYELLCGMPLSRHHSTFTSHTLLYLPPGLDFEVQSLLTQLLTYNPSERLGANGIDEIKQQPYFKNIDWGELRAAWAAPG